MRIIIIAIMIPKSYAPIGAGPNRENSRQAEKYHPYHPSRKFWKSFTSISAASLKGDLEETQVSTRSNRTPSLVPRTGHSPPLRPTELD